MQYFNCETRVYCEVTLKEHYISTLTLLGTNIEQILLEKKSQILKEGIKNGYKVVLLQLQHEVKVENI